MAVLGSEVDEMLHAILCRDAFAQRIINHLKKRMTQREICERVGTSTVHLSNVKRGISKCGDELMVSLCRLWREEFPRMASICRKTKREDGDE